MSTRSEAVKALMVSQESAGGQSMMTCSYWAADGVQLGLEPGLAVVDGGGQLDVGVGEEDVRGDDVQVGDGGWPHRQRLAVDDGDVDAFVGAQVGEVVHEDLGAIGLAVDVDEQDVFALVGQPCGQRDRCRCLADAAFL